MLKINPVKNVKYTLNTMSFKGGERTNYGIKSDVSEKNIVENGLLDGFAGFIKRSWAKLSPKVVSRAESIQSGLEETKKLNKVA